MLECFLLVNVIDDDSYVVCHSGAIDDRSGEVVDGFRDVRAPLQRLPMEDAAHPRLLPPRDCSHLRRKVRPPSSFSLILLHFAFVVVLEARHGGPI